MSSHQEDTQIINVYIKQKAPIYLGQKVTESKRETIRQQICRLPYPLFNNEYNF